MEATALLGAGITVTADEASSRTNNRRAAGAVAFGLVGTMLAAAGVLAVSHPALTKKSLLWKTQTASQM